MTIKDFLNAGYENFDAGFDSNWASCLLQKRISDKKGTKYFINVLPFKIMYSIEKIGFEVKLQFNKAGNTFNIEIFDNPNNNIQKIEKLCEQLWKNNKFEYYK